ncbi:hypothetical protein INQ10_24940, partial [Escherichia coli]|nr:hypothetical protein [Escherichia coli]
MNHIMKMKAEQKAAMSRLTPSRKALARKTLAVLAPVLAGGFMLAAPAMAPAQATAQTAAQSEVLPGYWEYTTNAVGQRETLQ